MNTFVRVMCACGLLGCLIAGTSAEASEAAEKLWNGLRRGCDKAAALEDIERTISMVAPGYEYELARDIYARHLCSERELKHDLETARENSPLFGITPQQRAAPLPQPTMPVARCPSRAEMVGAVRCLRAADDYRGGYRCAEVYRWDRRKMECLEASGITSADIDMPGPGLQPAPQPPAGRPPAPGAALTCGPQLTRPLVRSIEQNNPSAAPAVKLMALEKALQLLGCLPAAPVPSAPVARTTDCINLGGGMITCTTR